MSYEVVMAFWQWHGKWHGLRVDEECEVSIMLDSETKSKTWQRNDLVKQALEHSRLLIILADEGEVHCEDDGCAVLCGIIRDCAYKIRTHAEREKQTHVAGGLWETDEKE
jgi:hypothetical protein